MIYLDSNATTPVDPVAFHEMTPYLTSSFGNASSQGHQAGEKAAFAVARARSQVAALFGAEPSEVVWTSGATESNNLVLLGLFAKPRASKHHLVTAATEHSSVLGPCGELARRGVDVTILPVDRFGLVQIDALERAIRPETLAVSVASANNEIGTLQPLEQIAEVCRASGVYLHVDAAQSSGKLALPLDQLPVDSVSVSAHKMNGPQGIGALIVRRRRAATLCPLMWGGSQEQGLRPGTLAVPNIVGFGVAADIAAAVQGEESKRLCRLRDRFWSTLVTTLPDIALNGHPTQRLPNNLSVVLRYVDSESLRLSVPDLAFSSGSACHSASKTSSHVLKAIGVSDADARSTVRIGLGRFTTQNDVDLAAKMLITAVQRLRAQHPAYSEHAGRVTVPPEDSCVVDNDGGD